MALLFEVRRPDLNMEKQMTPLLGRTRHPDAPLHRMDDIAGALQAAPLDAEGGGGPVADEHGHQCRRHRFLFDADPVVDDLEMQFHRLFVPLVPADLDDDVFAFVGIVDGVADQIRQETGKLVAVPYDLRRHVLFHPVDDGDTFFLRVQRQDVRHVAQGIVEIERSRFQYDRFGSGERHFPSA